MLNYLPLRKNAYSSGWKDCYFRRLVLEAVLKLLIEPVLERNLREKILMHSAERGDGRQ